MVVVTSLGLTAPVSHSLCFFLTFLTFRRRLPVGGGVAGIAETFPSFSVTGQFLHDVPGFQVTSDSVFPLQRPSSSRGLPLHPQFDNCSDGFFFHPCFLPDDIFISPVLQQAHTHCPSHHSHLCCCRTLFIFN